MARELSKILTFKRLTKLGHVQQIALTEKIKSRFTSIERKINDPEFPAFARPYLYVALATCLETDLKYKYRAAMDIAGNDPAIFKLLYGEGKIDLDVLFHVVDEDITLADLVGESVSVSDMPNLIARTQNLLNAISGEKNSLSHYFAEASLKEAEKSGKENGVTYAFEAYDDVAVDLDYIFQIRHAVVHDVFSSGGPIRQATRKEKIRDVAVSCVAFLLLSDRSFFYHLEHGKIGPETIKPLNIARHQRLSNEASKTMRQLKRRFPSASDNLNKVEKLFDELLEALFAVAKDFDPQDADPSMSRYLIDAFFRSWSKTANALRLEATFARKK